MATTIPNFLHVFEKRLDSIKETISHEIKKPKKLRSKKRLKDLLNEAKRLKNSIKRVKLEHTKRCPHCNKEI